MKTRFLFFDLGNVLLRFNIAQMSRQAAEVCDCSTEDIVRAVWGDGMHRKIETGEISDDDAFEVFCRKIGKRPDRERLLWALNDIFSVVEEMQPFLKRLASEGFPRGVLSNTGPGHWNHCTKTFPFLLECLPENHVLSFRVGAMKPEAEIYRAAWETARKVVSDIDAGEILFIDDIFQNVLGARQFGLDAIQFESAEQLAEEIERRGFDPF